LALFIEVCEAIHHAHQRGIIHRDLKPSNILATTAEDRAVPKIIDFGVAKAIRHRLTEQTVFTRHGQLIGTPEYMSPEQAEMNGRDIDVRTDIYSLGVLLYELLTGSPPFRADEPDRLTVDRLRERILREKPPRPSTRLATLDAGRTGEIARHRRCTTATLLRTLRGDLDWIVMRALEKDRDRRYDSALSLAVDIRRHLRHEPIEAGPPSPVYTLRKFVRRHRGLVVGTAAVFVALLAGTVVSSILAVGQAAARREAERQTTIATAVNSFLMDDLLAQADPTVEPERDITLRHVVDRAARTVDERFADQPLVRAAVHHSLGRTYLGLGLFDSAETHLDAARNIWRNELGPDHPQSLTCLGDLASVYFRTGQHGQATELATETMNVSQQALGESHPITIAAAARLGVLHLKAARIKEADVLLTGALETARRTLGEDHATTLSVLNDTALLRGDQGRIQDAISMYADGLAVARRVHGDRHTVTLRLLENLAEFYWSQGQLAEAEPLQDELVDARRYILGDDHPVTLRATFNLARLHDRQGRYELAESELRTIHDGQVRLLGADHPDAINTLAHLAAMLRRLERLEEAEPMLRAVLDARVRAHGDQHPDSLAAMNDLASVHWNRKQYEAVEPLLQRVIDGYGQALGRDHVYTLIVRNNLAVLYRDWGRLEEAMRVHEAVAATGRQTLSTDNWYVASFVGDMGVTLVRLERWDDAEAALLEAIEIIEGTVGFEHYLAQRYIEELAGLLETRDRAQEATAWRARLPKAP
ncbi:MAG: serine/threonine-protein kinase, partial [Planctomycetota bacterium]